MASKETRILAKLTILQIKGMLPLLFNRYCRTRLLYLVLTGRVFPVPLRCISHANKIAGIVVELYNDCNEVSALINSPKRKLTSPVAASSHPSASMAARAMSSHESFNETAASRSPAKPTFLPAWRSPGSPLITIAVPSRCRHSLGMTEIRQVNRYVPRTPFLLLPLLVPLPRRRFDFPDGLARQCVLWMIRQSNISYCRISNTARNREIIVPWCAFIIFLIILFIIF